MLDNDGMDFHEIKNLLHFHEVLPVIRRNYQDSYMLGADYAVKSLSFVNAMNYTTETDLYHIENDSHEFINQFWARVLKLIENRHKITNQFFNIDDPVNPISNNFIVTSLSVRITVLGLARGTKNKTEELIAELNSPITSRFLSTNLQLASAKKIEERLFQRNAGLVFPTFDPLSPFFTIVMMWMTSMDDRVCRQCRSLHGKEFRLNQKNETIPEPQLDTHWNCRCMLVLAESTNLL